MEMDMIAFKILLESEFATLKDTGRFEGTSSDLEEGFIHLSSADQIDRVLQKHYPDITELHLVAVDVDSLGEEIRWEKASNGQMYPHLYNSLMLSKVIDHSPLKRRRDGSVEIPKILDTAKL